MHMLYVVVLTIAILHKTTAATSDNNTQTITCLDNCPTWFVLSNNSTSAGGQGSHCVCRKGIADLIICDQVQQQSYLHLGNCMTYNNSYTDKSDPDAVSFGGCPYVYYSNIVNHRYIALPHNVSDLNDVFCAPLNRDGLLCRDCIDGFGPSVVAFGYACANCTENSYGWILYILAEFVPATAFYFAVLTLRICITSAPMNCFVMFSQLVVIVLNQDPVFRGALMAELDKTSLGVFKVILTGYGFWNLDFFHSLIPPFCVSQSLKNIHVLALQYVSAFYPLLLIALTYACVELHGHNFKPIVLLWKPLHQCCVNVRRRWDSKASIIDVFATFLLLSYSKLVIVSLYLLHSGIIYNVGSGSSCVLRVDATVHFLSEEHLPFAITAIIILVFTIVPPLLLIFYPYKIFNRCLNCCSERQWLVLHIFVEAFQGCYKNGVTGGRDFRSMSGVYLLLRFILLLVNYHMVHQIGWLLRALMFLSLSIFILIVQPYKKSYMNVLDSLLLALLGFLTLLLITFTFLLPSDRSETLPLIIVITCSLPQLVLLLSVTYRQLKGKWIVQYIAGRVSALLKYVQRGKQAEDELSDAEEDPLPHRLASPDQYNRCLLSVSEQAHTNSAVQGPIPPVYTYGSIN